ncbi:hypothetical protein PTMSG1_06071 [Pyrenophora teres f. maculata]|nr:hypothetical protein PTMSG1_06071 [Pyrenophora teres f. maculata]
MAPTRPTTPPPGKKEYGRPGPIQPPPSPFTPGSRYPRNGMIMGSEPATVPPSPSMPVPGFDALTMGPVPGPSFSTRNDRGGKGDRKHNERTGAGVKKPQPKKKTASDAIAKLIDITRSGKPAQTSFRFMDLPGELRNEVYKHVFDNPKQALLVHRPRLATLRSRTRVDRGRTLASDIVEQEHDEELSTANKTARGSAKPKGPSRETNRPFWGLTQVCQQLRKEFHPIYMSKQEIGMDLTEIVQYLKTFYPTASEELDKLAAPGERKADMPFVGNITIAVGDKPSEMERSKEGIEIVHLLDIWANSFKIETGFGRYLKAHYVPQTDGEAKDLYRLFGRRVLWDQSCSAMNSLWRTILRTRALASVRVHRKPARTVAATVMRTTGPQAPVPETQPYIHIVFKKEFAEPWMTEYESVIPKKADWLFDRGFNVMEYFDVRVGVEQHDAKRRGAN